MTCVQEVRLAIACFSRGEGEVAEGGVSPGCPAVDGWMRTRRGIGSLQEV